jgi:hypothetical protein
MHRVENLHAHPFQFHSLHTQKNMYPYPYKCIQTQTYLFTYVCILLSSFRDESASIVINMYNRWVEMMAPVFSRASWRCAWHMIQVGRLYINFSDTIIKLNGWWILIIN